MNRHDHVRQSLTQRRRSIVLPKRRHHLSLALIFLILLIGLPLVWVEIFGSEDDAETKGTVSVATLPDDQRPSPLDLDSEGLPDLLASTVAIGDNPTDTINTTDALGNPPSTPRKAQSPQSKTIRLPDPRPAASPLDTSLLRSSEFGPIPAPNKSGLTPLVAYRGEVQSEAGRKPISIIVGGLGINTQLTDRAIHELPPAVTLSFAAHAPNLQAWINEARDAGHDVLLELPMEGATFNEDEPGADRALRLSASAKENRQNLHFLLSRAQGYAGIINYNGEALLNRSDVTAPLLSEIGASGLGLFLDGSFETPSIPTLARSLSLPYNIGFGQIDPSPDRNAIDQQLSLLINEAKEGSGTVGVGFVYPQTIDAVKGWAATLASDDLILVPATAALK